MAHHFSYNDRDKKLSKEASRSPDWNFVDGGGAPHQRRMQPQGRNNNHHPMMTRSNPIAIVRNPDEMDAFLDSSDDEADSTIDVELDALKIAARSHRAAASLPSHLLRAPRLGSIPTDEDYWVHQHHYPSMLPPAMNAADQPMMTGRAEDRATSYGSLRDSNSRGRFLDGPSSYRDRHTGDIRRLEHKVRFRENGVETLASSLPSLSIGERIMMKSRQQQVATTKLHQQPTQNEPASSLAALLEATVSIKNESEIEVLVEEETEVIDDDDKPTSKISTFYDYDQESHLPNNMLSTSLTGLEVLQAGLRIGPLINTSPPLHTGYGIGPSSNVNAMDDLPRDAIGYNALLPRSYSDPTHGQPVHHRTPGMLSPTQRSPAMLAAQQRSPLVAAGMEGGIGYLQSPLGRMATAVSTRSPPPLRLETTPPRSNSSSMMLTDRYAVANDNAAACETDERIDDVSSRMYTEHDPDTDCAFDLDME